MTSPYLLPDWLPWWIALILLLIGLVYALILLLVPFSVFGVKPRLEAIEEQLLTMQEELRSISLRVNAGPRRGGPAETEDRPRTAAPVPPIPPAPEREPLVREPLAREPSPRDGAPRDGRVRGGTPQRLVSRRIEPRLD